MELTKAANDRDDPGMPLALRDPVAWEEELVQRMRDGQEAAFDEFADEFLPRLFRFARSRLKHRDPIGELTRDLVQTTLCKAMERIHTFRGESRLFSWLCTCCFNEIQMHYRKAEQKVLHVEFDQTSQELVERGSRAPQPERRLTEAESRRQVHRALDELPAKYARALEWKYLEGASVRQIAERLEVSAKAAESLLSRARQGFRLAYTTADSDRSTSAVVGSNEETS